MRSPEQPLFIHFEGTDFAGKTTASRNIQSSIEGPWEVRKNSLGFRNPISSLADELDASGAYDIEVIGNVYAAAILADIKSFDKPQINRIQDSANILRSLAYYAASGHTRLQDTLLSMLPEHPDFTFSFILTSDMETRRQRLEAAITEDDREVTANDMMIVSDPERFKKIDERLVEYCVKHFNATLIDTTSLTESKTSSLIKVHIEETDAA